MSTRNSVSFYLNGVKKTVSGEHVFLPLSSYLRYELQQTGTKVVCAEGDCGACTVMMSKNSFASSREYFGLNSCIAMTFAMDGCNIVTVEGLQSKTGELSEVQCSMVRNFGGQCGFCTPGFVMAITNLHEQKEKPTEQNVKNYLTGNLCRCTGYAPIIKSALDVDTQKHVKVGDKYPVQDFVKELSQALHVKTEFSEIYAPLTMEEAVKYKSENPDVIIFSGSTDLGVQFNKGNIRPKKILSLHLIPELYKAEIKNNKVLVGSRVSLNDLQKLVSAKVPKLDQFLNIFASPQIKHSATLVGNLANASPIADTTPLMMALDAVIHVKGQKGNRDISLHNFYLGYKKLNLQQDEIITSVSFDIPKSDSLFENYKISQRRDLDISTVNASFKFDILHNKIQSARIVYGGVGPTTIRLNQVEDQITGQDLNQAWLEATKNKITQSLKPLTDLRGTADYRQILIGNLFEKFAKEQLGL
jgi:xanthine dehydrogenase small subunit